MNRSDAATRQRLARLAWLLDSSVPLPGGFRVGLDGLIGLIPGVGDALGAVFSGYILAQAARMGVPKSVLLQMALNVGLETVVGVIPVLGDLFDFAFKANNRNVALLNRYLDSPHATRTRSRWVVGGALLGVAAMLILIVILALEVLAWLIQAVAH